MVTAGRGPRGLLGTEDVCRPSLGCSRRCARVAKLQGAAELVHLTVSVRSPKSVRNSPSLRSLLRDSASCFRFLFTVGISGDNQVPL